MQDLELHYKKYERNALKAKTTIDDEKEEQIILLSEFFYGCVYFSPVAVFIAKNKNNSIKVRLVKIKKHKTNSIRFSNIICKKYLYKLKHANMFTYVWTMLNVDYDILH